MRAWYQSQGIIEPEYYRRVIGRREVLVENAAFFVDRHPERKIG